MDTLPVDDPELWRKGGSSFQELSRATGVSRLGSRSGVAWIPRFMTDRLLGCWTSESPVLSRAVWGVVNVP